MFNSKDIRPIPKHIIKMIKNKDKGNIGTHNRFYAYYTTIKKELVKITVVCKNFKEQWFCKQVVAHGIHSENCYVKDLEYCLMGFTVGWYDLNLSNRQKRYENGKWVEAGDKYYDPYAPIVNKKYPLKYDAYKYSLVNKYPDTNVLKYLRIYEQYPETEYLMKLGLYHLATKKSILIKARKNKDFRKWLIHNLTPLKNEYGNYPYFSAKTILFSYKQNLSIIEGYKLDHARKELLDDYNYRTYINDLIKPTEVLDFMEYLNKQNTDVGSYADYLQACQYLNLDMTLSKNKYPKEFKRWHDIRIDEYHTAQALDDEKKRKELYEQFSIIANKYSSLERNLTDNYVVIIAKSPNDLINEGEILHHCVGRMNYDQKFAREETLIFFVRNANDINKPFVTLEYSLSNHKILQCYGYADSKPQDEVLEFVNKKWLPYANRKIRKIA